MDAIKPGDLVECVNDSRVNPHCPVRKGTRWRVRENPFHRGPVRTQFSETTYIALEGREGQFTQKLRHLQTGVETVYFKKVFEYEGNWI